MSGPTGAFSGDGGPAQLATAFGVAFDATGNLIVADSGNDRIREVVAKSRPGARDPNLRPEA